MTIHNNIASLFKTFSGTNPHTVINIQGDASSRQYFRVIGAGGSVIACYDPSFTTSTAECFPFLLIHGLLSGHAIAVPEVKATLPAQGLMLLEDCGDMLLQNLFGSPEEASLPACYRAIIDQLIHLQSIEGSKSEIPFSLSFDDEKLMFEFDFFIENALRNYFAPIFNETSIGALRREFEAISRILVKPQHFVLNHRDFHSRNILIYQNKPVIIDFQDARMGLPQYDAVSLIRDSYIKLDPVLAEELKAYHYHALRDRRVSTMSFDEYLYYFDIMAFQRNIKAIGTFCYQTCVKKKSSFQHSIAPTIAYLPDYIHARQELKAAGKILQPLLDGACS